MSYLEDKAIAITGAGRGIGRAVALECARQGARVVVNDYGVSMDGTEPTSEIADSVAQEIRDAGGTAIANAGDVSTMEGGARVVQGAIDEWGRIDGVVCVAGILRERMLFNMEEHEWDAVLAVHLKGTFTVFRAASAVMRKQKFGSLVGFTSGAFAASIAQANYAAAKGGIVSLVRSAAAGMKRYGVNSNAIAPVARSRMSGQVPYGLEMGEPEDVAPMVAYLMSEKADDITGQIYTVNGGTIAVWNQPEEVRSMYNPGGHWSVEDIDKHLMSKIGTEEMPIFDYMRRVQKAKEAAEKAKAEGDS